MLKEGDYSTPNLLQIARVERKTVSDFTSTLTWGRERFDRELVRLDAFRWKCLVVEGSLAECMHLKRMHPNAIVGSLASMFARHDVPCFFMTTPEMVGRFLAGTLRRWEERRSADGEAA
jgi:ERCC4-type nuclease